MPEAVFVSFSTRLTITRSCNGRSFIVFPYIEQWVREIVEQ
jgi:hypothetical protein